MAANLKFRIATEEDAPQIQELIQSAFRAEDVRPDWVGLANLAAGFTIDLKEVLTMINQPNSVVLVATTTDVATDGDLTKAPDMAVENVPDGTLASVEADVLVAVFQLLKRSDELARFAMFAVDQRYHRRGFGRRSIAFAEDYCRRVWGVSRIDLDALSTRPALIAWYERCGFRRTGHTVPFPIDKLGGLEVPADLHFITLDKNLPPVDSSDVVS